MKLKVKTEWIESFSSVQGKGKAKALQSIEGKKLESFDTTEGMVYYYKLTSKEHMVVSMQYYNDTPLNEALNSAKGLMVPAQIVNRFCDICNKENEEFNDPVYMILDDGVFPHYGICQSCFNKWHKMAKVA